MKRQLGELQEFYSLEIEELKSSLGSKDRELS
jgi:hypothetical protein